MGQSALRDGETLYQGRIARRTSKGSRVNIPEPGRGGGRQRKLLRRRRRGPRGGFSFLLDGPPTLKSD
jgi:hypothetical protein